MKKQTPQTIEIQFLGRPRRLNVQFAHYANRARAVILEELDGEQFAVVSVNMPEASDSLPLDVFYLKEWSELEPVAAELKRLGYVEAVPGIPTAYSGFIQATAYRWVSNPAPKPEPKPEPVCTFSEAECGGVLGADGQVHSDADPGL